AAQQPVADSIVRAPVRTRSGDPRDIADVAAFAANERRQQTVQPVEIGQRQTEVTRKRLQAAAAIAGAVARDRAADHIGEARLEALESRGLAANTLAGNEAKPRRALLQL